MKGNSIQHVWEPASNQVLRETGPPCRILVADDDVCIRELSAEFLIKSGYQVDAFEDGAAAWEALQMQAYNLLITDNNMPRLTGVELVKKVRAAHMPLPVILVSGVIPDHELDRNPWLQLSAKLAKPFTCDELLGTVKTVLRANDAATTQLQPLQDSEGQRQAGRLSL